MEPETKNDGLPADDMSAAADAAIAEELSARTDTNPLAYTHRFRTPFTYQGRTFEALTFDWGRLTGNDSLAIENEMLMKGKTLVVPAYTGEYLTGMAVRACTERDASGRRVVSTDTICAMPLGDFQAICSKARSFLLRTGR